MIHIPPEIILTVLGFIPLEDLRHVMLTSRMWAHYARLCLYFNVDLDFVDQPKSSRAAGCLRTLASSQSAASAVRHLSARGIAPQLPEETKSNFIAAMKNMTNLMSVDLVKGVLLSSGSGLDSYLETFLLTETICRPAGFLPNLIALNVRHAHVARILAPGRPLTTIRIEDPLDPLTYTETAHDLVQSTCPLSQLQITVAPSDVSSALDLVRSIPLSFPGLVTLGLHIKIRTTNFMSWSELFANFFEISALLSSLHSLTTLSLVIDPHHTTPTQSTSASASSESGSPNTSQIDAENAAHYIVRTWLPALRRIELRWQGWMIGTHGDGKWTSVPQNTLLRLKWKYESDTASERGR